MVAIDLITGRHGERYLDRAARSTGVYASTARAGGSRRCTARATILATGGAGRAYLYSTAPRGATGDGIAMAWRAGCRVSNMEFMQFHPTCLYNLEVKNFLITEAVRGEGGLLKHPDDRPPLHARLSTSAPSSRRATSSPARSTMRSSARPRLRPSRHQPPRRPSSCAAISRTSTRGCSSSASTSPASRSRSCRRSITPAAAWWSTCDGRTDAARPLCGRRGHPVGPARRQPARLQLAARMLRVRRGGGARISPRSWDDLPAAAADPRLGRKPGHRPRRGSRHPAELARDPPLHVELCRHRPHHQAARARQAPDRAAAPGGRAIITAISGSRPT